MKLINLNLASLLHGASAMAMTVGKLDNTPAILVALQILMVLGTMLAAKLNLKFGFKSAGKKRGQAEMADAVVGFADITSSQAITSTLDAQQNLRLRQAFQKCAARRAAQFGVCLVYMNADGFQFLASTSAGAQWRANVVRFCETLSADYQNLIAEENFEFETSLRFGVSRGPVTLTSLRGTSWQVAAVGLQVNHAARLCYKAAPGEIVFSEQVWSELNETVYSRSAIIRVYCDIKGFAARITEVRVNSGLEAAA